ncbi:hypothetical protein GJ496_002209 [Pomphorhynchus laevis]|nr:hypothetical protein GJ496_002209 [Pomphorhynchus laevis]
MLYGYEQCKLLRTIASVCVIFEKYTTITIFNSRIIKTKIFEVMGRTKHIFKLLNRLSIQIVPQIYIAKMSTLEPRLILVTVPDTKVADKIADIVVSTELAACVNIVPGITSVYKWENKMNRDAELLLMIKTIQAQVENIIRCVNEHHPYDVPEIITVPLDKDSSSKPYIDWVIKTASPSGNKIV